LPVTERAAANGRSLDMVVRVSARAQIVAIARSEWLILWRGLALRVLMLTPILGGGVLLLIAGDLSAFFPSVNTTDDASRMIINGEMLAVMSAGFLFVLGMYIYPLIVADRVPADRHLHVYEMLVALPLTDAVYLAGKVCGALLATGAAALIAMAGMGVIALLHYRVIDLVAYLEIVLHVLIAQSLLVALAVLLGSIARSTRWALVLILALLIVPELLQRLPLIAALLPSRAEYVIYSSLSSMQNVARLPLEVNTFNLLEDVYLRLHVIGFVQVVVVALIALLWRGRAIRKGS
jgi:ABC-type Na+ efflux pump permease subunit